MVKTRLKISAVVIALLVVGGFYYLYTTREDQQGDTVIKFAAVHATTDGVQLTVTYGYNARPTITKPVTSPWRIVIIAPTKVTYLTLKVQSSPGQPGVYCSATANDKDTNHSPTNSPSNFADCSGTVITTGNR